MKSPHYTRPHIFFPTEAIASHCLSFASLYWEKASSTGRNSKVPTGAPAPTALVGYSLLCQVIHCSALPGADRTRAAPSPSLGPKLASCSPFPLVGRRVRGLLSPSRKQLQSKRRPPRKHSFDVTYISLRCIRKDGGDT